MKRLLSELLLAIVTITITLSGCANHKVMICGPAGTQIYRPANILEHGDKLIATIGSSGTIKYDISSGDSYLLKAKIPSSDIIIPFALDYKKGHRTRNFILMVSGGFYLLPWSWWGCGDEYLFPGSANMNFEKKIYLPHSVNVPAPVFDEYVPPVSEKADTPASSSNHKIRKKEKAQTTSISSKKLNIPAARVAGQYRCSGSLSQGGQEIESYPELTIKIERAGNCTDAVTVNVLDADGTSFFAENEKYSVVKEKDGSYTLVHESIPTAKITLDRSKRITFVHPAVTIEGDVYSLSLRSLRSH